MSIKRSFPKKFYWGAASAAYQVEGGITNTDWAYEAQVLGRLPLADSGPDHYNRFKEDFDIAQSLGHNAHRFSVEWARIEPSEGEFSIDAIRHYAKVLNALHDRKLTPFITLWHFTLPKWLYDKGGALSPEFPKFFARYAGYVVEHLGDQCSHWVTINEPNVFASNGWLRGIWPPLTPRKPLKMLKVLKHLSRAHIDAYTIIKQKNITADVGIVKDNIYFHANWNPLNKIVAKSIQYFWNRRFLNSIQNHVDTIGLNYYFHKKLGDKEVYKKNDMGWDIFPEGIYHTLIELKRYNKAIFVAEAGIADHLDAHRAQYIQDLLFWVHRAIEDGVPVKGFMYWSLTDNFEWAEGYKERFGLIEIDYKTKQRRVRDSAHVYASICRDNAITIK